MAKMRPNKWEAKTPGDLQEWFGKHPDSFCYVTYKVRQNWYIGHNSIMINDDRKQLNFKDIAGGVWLVTVKENKTDGKKEESTEGN